MLMTHKVFAFSLLLVLSHVEAMAQPPSHFMGARWGISIEEAREVIKAEAKRIVKDDTKESRPALHAKGLFLGSQTTLTYFFTPRSKRLYRVDVIFDRLQMYEKAKAYLVKRFDPPSSSQSGIDIWSWEDKSHIQLSKAADQVVLSYSSGELSKIHDQEEREPKPKGK
jgi:hypothetical protein